MTSSRSPRRRPRRAVLCAVAAALLAAWPSVASAQAPFAASSAWNAPLAADAPVAPDSAALVAELRRQLALPTGAWINAHSYSTPVYTVAADQATVRVALDVGYAPLQADFERVPLPPDARPARGSDQHLTVYQPSTDTLWEFWLMRKLDGGWHARWGGRLTGLSSSPGYLQSPLGATATSLPLLGGLMRIDELQTGRIDHALALAIPSAKAKAVTWPAQRTDGTETDAAAIPEGTRFRLDPALDVDALALRPVAAAIAKAAQRYGIVVRDQAGAVTFYAEDPYQYGADPYPALYQGLQPSQLLARFPWDRLQVVVPDRRAFAGASAAPPAPAPLPTTPVTATSAPAPPVTAPGPAAPGATTAPRVGSLVAVAANGAIGRVVGPRTRHSGTRRGAKRRCARRTGAARARCIAADRRKGARGKRRSVR